MAGLVVMQGECDRRVYEAPAEGALTMGRHPDNVMVLQHPSVSRHHARLWREGEGFWLEDLDSSNGTTVNGKAISRQALQVGDAVGIAHYRFRFEKAVSEVAQRAGAAAAARAEGQVVVEDDRPAGAIDAGPAGTAAPSSRGSEVLARVDTRKLASGEIADQPEELRRKLRLFYTFVDAFGTLLDLDSVMEKVGETVFEIFTQADRAFVLLADPGTDEFTPRAVRRRRGDPDDRITVSRTIVDEAMREGRGILMVDAKSDERFSRAASVINFHIRSAMCVPLISRNETYGIIHVDTTDQRARFTEDDLYIMAGIASQAAVAIENANLHEELVHTKVREHDFRLARTVQRSFLPSAVPSLESYEFFAHYSPAFEVGGDFYDFIRLPGGRIAVVLGDVPGKGFSAALMMAKLVGDIRHTALTQTDPRAVVGEVNRLLAQSETEKAFVTLVFLSLDPSAGRCALVNAGHMAPVIRRADGTLDEPHAASGLPLGVAEDTAYDQDLFDLAAGDSLLVYTDGISEARAGADRFYGSDRLRACVTAGPADVAALGKHVLDDVTRFVGETVQSDDITLVGFGRTA